MECNGGGGDMGLIFGKTIVKYVKHKTRFHDYSSKNEGLLYGKQGRIGNNTFADELPIFWVRNGLLS